MYAYLREWFVRPQRIWLRRALFQVHLWTGLTLSFYMVTISITGSVAVARREIARMSVPQPVPVGAGPRLTREQLTATAEQAHPSGRVQTGRASTGSCIAHRRPERREPPERIRRLLLSCDS